MRNLRLSKQWNALVDRLTEEKDLATGQTAFATLRELMCFAASLGFEHDSNIPLGNDTVDFVEGRVFPRSDVALDLLYLIALASERKVTIVDEEHEEEALQLFENHANGGLAVLDGWLSAHPADESPVNSLMVDLRRHGFLESKDSGDGDSEDVAFD